MRVLHTSDWHLGASLGGVARAPEHTRFLSWLTETAVEEAADLLIVAGDVFDHASPSADALRTWYRFLVGLRETPVRQVVVVAGNHDSPARLEAPREVLDAIDVRVVGTFDGSDASRSRLLCPVVGADGEVDCVVLALPYVHEYRLGFRTAGLDPLSIARLYRDRFAELYTDLADEAERRWPGAPLIATGHLTCEGATSDDYPVPIHSVGSVGALPDSIFDRRIRYAALGHVHRPMQVGTGPAWYCGSPIALRLGEQEIPRRVLRVDLEPNVGRALTPVALEVPVFRRLVRVAGELDEVVAGLRDLTWTEALSPLVHVALRLPRRQPEVVAELRRRAAELWGEAADRPQLVQIRQDVDVAEADGAGGSEDGEREPLAALDAEDVFRLLCDARGEPLDDALLGAFRSLLTERGDA